ncbi:hypothetical protein ABZ895_28530 [Streptomyces californicus]|uniref:hypothetical protein n=1 Tax=Streptomyces californicus TaxID=67351 RepID=UPI0033EE9145
MAGARYVYLVEADQQLLLDFDHPACCEELRRELVKRTTVVQHEILPPLDGMWLQDEAASATPPRSSCPSSPANPSALRARP